jgi:hypothetical protein
MVEPCLGRWFDDLPLMVSARSIQAHNAGYSIIALRPAVKREIETVPLGKLA